MKRFSEHAGERAQMQAESSTRNREYVAVISGCSSLERHTHISTTMDQYGNASAVEKRKANRRIVERVLGREKNQQLSVQ